MPKSSERESLRSCDLEAFNLLCLARGGGDARRRLVSPLRWVVILFSSIAEIARKMGDTSRAARVLTDFVSWWLRLRRAQRSGSARRSVPRSEDLIPGRGYFRIWFRAPIIRIHPTTPTTPHHLFFSSARCISPARPTPVQSNIVLIAHVHTLQIGST